ncbi:PepSY domain-containing protein [Corallococcus exiguus]|uniref:Ig-like domain-containing protein n=1 Tax=Corallococcus exiguus TaxID=83462 RepID=UPI001A8F679B|nr:Ig-like domain-containing protein [Corallococcus exiguus]MBN8469279.1 PepSY domain-containing protein [Corallococcus exiguus]
MQWRTWLRGSLVLSCLSCGPTSPEDAPEPEQAQARTRAEQLVAERGFDLRDVSLVPDAKGVRQTLHFRGVPVWGLEAKSALGQTFFSNARFQPTGAVETEARLTEAQARDAALAALKDSTAKVESARLVLLPTEVRQLRKDAVARVAGPRNAEDFERVVTGLRLIYRIKLITSGDSRRRWSAQVDARTGEVLRLEPLARTGLQGEFKKARGTGYYAGSVNFVAFLETFEQVYRLRDTYGNDYEAYVPLYPRGSTYELYQSADTTFGDGLRYSGGGVFSTNGETAAVDAYHGVGLAWSVYQAFLGRAGPTGTGRPFFVRVHEPLANAYYDPDEFEPAITFGYRVLGVNPKTPYTTTDVVGHELAHDFFARELAGDPSDVHVEHSEQAGLNEGTGDIFGVVTELLRDAKRASSTSTNIDGVTLKDSNVTIGEETGLVVRNVLSPQFPEWFPSIGQADEHLSGGPLGRMFLLLAYGASAQPQSPWHAYLVPEGFSGLGPTEALRIWAQAVQLMPLGSDYLDARQAALAAATARDGVHGGTRMKAVARAFAAVNVGYKPDSVPPQLTLNCRQVLQDIECTGTITDAELPGQYTTAPRLVVDGGTQIKTLSGWTFEQVLPGAALAHGNHTIQLQAWDYWQNSATKTVTVTMDKQAPTFSALRSGSPKQPRYSVTPSDASGIRAVDFGVDGQLLYGIYAPPYEQDFDTSTWTDGNHDVFIRVYDTYMNATVQHFALKADNTPPVLTMTVAAGTESPFTVNVSVTDISAVARVDFKVDGFVFATRTNEATTYQASYTPPDPLAHNITVEVTDAFGNKATTSRAAPLDTTPPAVAFAKTQPGSLVRLSVSVADGCGVEYPYALYVDGTMVAQPTTPAYVLDFGESMAAGAHTFQAVVRDLCGNTANFQTAFIKDLTPPVITGITRDDTQPKKPKFTVQCTDTEGVHHVELREGGAVTQTDTTAPYEFVVDTTGRADGDYSLLFQCTDINGVSSSPETRTVTADNTGPTINLTLYGSGRAYLISAEPASDPRGIQSITLAQLLIPAFSVTLTQAPWSAWWNIPGTGSIQSDLPFLVTAKDKWGNTSSKSLYCSVSTTSTVPQYRTCHP